MQPPRIAFLGMSHLGLNTAVGAAEKGFNITCFDLRDDHLKSLKSGHIPFSEPDLNELFDKNSEKISFSYDFSSLKSADIIYLSIDIKTDDQGTSDTRELEQYLEKVYQYANKESVVVILSQISPGFTRTIKWPSEQLFYHVETLIFGRAIERTLYPERFIIGCADPKEPLPKLFLQYLSQYNCPILPMRYESAELTKISINLFLISSVTTSNTIAELCENIGANWDEIIPALQLDKRIGPSAYLKAGLGISGGNLERDMASFCRLAGSVGSDDSVVKSWQENSIYRKDWVLRRIHKEVLPHNRTPKIGILGLSYKENTNSIKNSPSIALLHSLKGFSIKAYDPVVKHLPDSLEDIEIVSSKEQACNEIDVLIVMTPWNEFRNINCKAHTIIDPFGMLEIEQDNNYHKLGV